MIIQVINNNPQNLKVYYEVQGKQQYAHLKPGEASIVLAKGQVMTLGRVPMIGDQQWLGLAYSEESQLLEDEHFYQKKMAAQILLAFSKNNELSLDELVIILNDRKKTKKASKRD